MVTSEGMVGEARAALGSVGAHVLPGAAVRERLGLVGDRWTEFAGHWEHLAPDRYAAAAGTHRLRRYGRFLIERDGSRPLPHVGFRQPVDTNPLFPDAARDFEPLTGGFVAEPALGRLLELLRGVAEVIEDADRWLVHVHPFRVLGGVGSQGDATPEGRHQDGVTLVSSLLVARENATGGCSRVLAPAGGELLAATLSEPGELMLGDDRRTWHSVTPIEPVDPALPARRDVLVVTLTAC